MTDDEIVDQICNNPKYKRLRLLLEIESKGGKFLPGQIIADYFGTHKERIRQTLDSAFKKLRIKYANRGINNMGDIAQLFEFKSDKPIVNPVKHDKRTQTIPYWKQNRRGNIVRTEVVCWSCKKKVSRYPNEKCPNCGSKARRPH
jgi:hypothetical protein